MTASRIITFFVGILFVFTSLSSCVKDFDININENQSQLVVEAYINNQLREYNYVILSRSLNYLSPGFQSTPVTRASVYITEGEVINNRYNWNPSTKLQLTEASLPMLPANFTSGVYFDPRLVSNPQNALLGTPGKCYLLEISENGNQYTSIATLLPPVQVDSLTRAFPYTDEDDGNRTKWRITSHYKDPDTINNTQLYYIRSYENRQSFGWGALTKSRMDGSDNVTNGQYMHITHPRGFVEGDTVNYFMASVTRDVYNFWDTFNKARDNNGPFATPIALSSNIKGTRVTGCFAGLSLSSRTITID